jgi:hypothetical protein
MAQAASISLSKFTETVQAAVKVAVQKHPKFKLEQPTQVSISYLIRGIPVPDAIAGNVSVRETQAFANEVASQLGAGGVRAYVVRRAREAGGSLPGRASHDPWNEHPGVNSAVSCRLSAES